MLRTGLRGIPRGEANRVAVSVLIPTRGRPEKLRRAIKSLVGNASPETSFEIILKVDDDDLETLQFLKSMPITEMPHTYALSGPRGNGYLDIHHYIHDMARVSRGYWLFCFNDDAEMLTPNWNDYFDTMPVDFEEMAGTQTYFVDDIWFMFFDIKDRVEQSSELFAVTKKTFDVLGHLSLNMGVDIWLESISFAIAKRLLVPEISIRHENEQDKTLMEGRQKIASSTERDLTNSIEVRQQRLQDALKLLDYMKDVQSRKENPLVCEFNKGGATISYAGFKSWLSLENKV